MRRDVCGGKRGDGHRRGKRVRRAESSRIRLGKPDDSVTGVAGLARFGSFAESLGLDRQLRGLFFELKAGPLVVYPMENQIRLLIDATVVGEKRVFGLEYLAADPLFVRLAGGVVPSIDTVYRDLARFDEMSLIYLEGLMALHGAALADRSAKEWSHLDIDTTVEPLFGRQEGALPGPNPRYPGRPSFHPMLAVFAESQTCLGAQLRAGDRGLGDEDADKIGEWVGRARAALGQTRPLVVRVDAGGDCTRIFKAIHDRAELFLVKARLTPDLCKSITVANRWTTVERDAFGMPVRQVAEIKFQRAEWRESGIELRVIAVRSRDRENGKQVYLWTDADYTVQAYITNDSVRCAEDIANDYNGRAQIEPVIAELKNGFGIGKVPSATFDANHAMFLIKLLTHNLVRRYVAWCAPHIAYFRIEWMRRALFCVPGRLLRSGRQWTLRVPSASLLNVRLN